MNDRFKAFAWPNLPDGIKIDREWMEWTPGCFEYIFNTADCYEGYDLMQVLPAQAPDRKTAIFVYRRRDEN